MHTPYIRGEPTRELGKQKRDLITLWALAGAAVRSRRCKRLADRMTMRYSPPDARLCGHADSDRRFSPSASICPSRRVRADVRGPTTRRPVGARALDDPWILAGVGGFKGSADPVVHQFLTLTVHVPYIAEIDIDQDGEVWWARPRLLP